MKKKKIGPGRVTVVMMTCTLAVPTVAAMFGAYPANVTLELLTPALATGVLLGLAHLVLRPVLRILFAPLGCLTLGLFGMVIDIALLYLCGALVQGFQVPGLLYALLTSMLVNAICALAG